MTSSMGVITLVYLTLALPVVTLCYPDQWLHQIYVDNQTGVNNSSCWEGGYSTPCLSLNLALTGAQHYYYYYSTAIILQPGQHQLHSGSEIQLRYMSQLAIVGNGSQGEVVIRCEPLAGLAFFRSQDIELRNVNLVKCGALQNSTSKLGEHSYSFLQIQVAVLFLNCKAIQLTNVHVTVSNGAGAIVCNPVSVVNITSCLFSHNGVSGEQEAMYGGGGLVIEVNEVTSQSSCIITNSTFTVVDGARSGAEWSGVEGVGGARSGAAESARGAPARPWPVELHPRGLFVRGCAEREASG